MLQTVFAMFLEAIAKLAPEAIAWLKMITFLFVQCFSNLIHGSHLSYSLDLVTSIKSGVFCPITPSYLCYQQQRLKKKPASLLEIRKADTLCVIIS